MLIDQITTRKNQRQIFVLKNLPSHKCKSREVWQFKDPQQNTIFLGFVLPLSLQPFLFPAEINLSL